MVVTVSHVSVKQLQSRREVIPVHRQVEMIAAMRTQDVIEVGSVTMVAAVPKVVDQVPEVLVPSAAIPHQLASSAS